MNAQFDFSKLRFGDYVKMKKATILAMAGQGLPALMLIADVISRCLTSWDYDLNPNDPMSLYEMHPDEVMELINEFGKQFPTPASSAFEQLIQQKAKGEDS